LPTVSSHHAGHHASGSGVCRLAAAGRTPGGELDNGSLEGAGIPPDDGVDELTATKEQERGKATHIERRSDLLCTHTHAPANHSKSSMQTENRG